MPAFEYTAYNPDGKAVTGTIQADSGRQARRLLREQKLEPMSLTESRVQQVQGRASGNRLPVLDLSLMLRQLSILAQSGLPMAEALQMTAEQAETPRQRRVVERWHGELMEGRSLSEAMVRGGFRVPDSVIAGIAVGEESGHLAQLMLQLADELEVSAENRKTITRALIYPLTLLTVAVIVVTFMMSWVVPRIIVVFESSDRVLPFVTRVVIAMSGFIRGYGLFVLVALVAVFFLARAWLRAPANREAWHGLLLKLPGFGRWIRMGAVADWSRSLGILLRSGVPALSALKIAASVVGNLSLRRQFDLVTESMRKGSSLYKALENTTVSSGFLQHMVGSGEASSELDTMLLRVADYYSLRLKNAVEVFLKIMNPVLIVLMGGMIMVVVAAIMLPIMDMNNMI